MPIAIASPNVRDVIRQAGAAWLRNAGSVTVRAAKKGFGLPAFRSCLRYSR
jgi:hypothetical protein